MKVRLPGRFSDATMAGLDPAFAPVRNYLANMDEQAEAGQGLLLSGPAGVGKSWAMAALTRAAVLRTIKKPRRFDYEFVTAPDMFDRLPAVGGGQPGDFFDERRHQSWWQTCSRVPWLVINDLGKEYRGGSLQEQVTYKLGRILRARSERLLVTHVTTNLTLRGEASLKDVYGESVVSLLAEMTRPFAINGADRRRT